MVSKTFLVLCASALLLKTISAQCIGAAPGLIGYGTGLGGLGGLGAIGGLGAVGGLEAASYGCGLGLGAPVAASSGGGLTVTSSSPIAPNGVSVVSENAIEGIVEVGGQLPVLAAVGLEGQLPTGGAAGTTYTCGNGNVGISGESLAASGIRASGLAGARVGAGLINAGLAGAGLTGAGLAGTGLAGAGLAGSQLLGAELAATGRLAAPCGCGRVY